MLQRLTTALGAAGPRMTRIPRKSPTLLNTKGHGLRAKKYTYLGTGMVNPVYVTPRQGIIILASSLSLGSDSDDPNLLKSAHSLPCLFIVNLFL